LADLILLTDTTGMLTGEEKISVLGVSVAIQRETIRQRQIEFLQTTMNPTDMKIMGIKGRGTVLRSVSTTIGLNGEEVVPNEDKLEQMERAQQHEQQGGSAAQQIEQGVSKGIGAAVTRITTELAAGEIAEQLGMPEGKPTHIGTPTDQMGPPSVSRTDRPAPVGSARTITLWDRAPDRVARTLGPQKGGPRSNLMASPSGTPRLSPGPG
jgi:hypothetical protein